MPAVQQPDPSSARQIGKLIGTYGLSRTTRLVSWFMALLFGGVGAAVLWFFMHPSPGTRFDGDITLVYKVCYGLIAVGVALALLPSVLSFFWTTFHIHDNAIRAVKRGSDRTVRFEDLEDLFLYYYGGVAYRTSAGDPWTLIQGHVHRYAEMKALLREKLIEQRGERLYAELIAGKTVTFHCISDKTALQKAWIGGGGLEPAYDITLTARHLAINGKRIDVQRIADVSINNWSERAKILSVDGEVFHQMHVTAVMSLDVLYALLARLQGDRAVVETAERQSRLRAMPTGDMLTRPL